MRCALSLVTLLASLLIAPSGWAQQRPVELAPNAPSDRPVTAVQRCQWDAALKAMEPYIAEARMTYPAARQRYLAGLPPRHTMFVTTRLHDAAGHSEQVFVVVDSILGGRIVGRIWSEIGAVATYRRGQRHEVDEASLVDWMVAKPDGSEEGNVVGKFIDTYSPPRSCDGVRSAG
jgi:hypothetical protein